MYFKGRRVIVMNVNLFQVKKYKILQFALTSLFFFIFYVCLTNRSTQYLLVQVLAGVFNTLTILFLVWVFYFLNLKSVWVKKKQQVFPIIGSLSMNLFNVTIITILVNNPIVTFMTVVIFMCSLYACFFSI